MSDIKDYFSPVADENIPAQISQKSWAKSTYINRYDFPSLEGVKVVLFGLDDGCMDKVRSELYKLVQPYKINIADIGNIRRGASDEDTGYAITETYKYLLDERIIPILVTDEEKWGYYIYKAYEFYGSYVSFSYLASDINIWDPHCVRLSDFAAQHNGSPNGFFGDEICRLMRYAGMSSKIYTLFICGYDEQQDIYNHSAKLLSQMIWYFVDGIMARQSENPEENEDGFMKYVVGIKENAHSINFYKSQRTEKWWMEIPNPMNKAAHHGPIVVPCSYQDYIKASNDELPERWWNIYQKLI
ncbi:MAG: hypothetical protein HYZ42_07280 [Bacteroidetes bacterium]|nr:hypothetical protein [Bacteroidota bacterium]